MQGNRDRSQCLIWAIREGRLKNVREMIEKYGLSDRPEWSGGYTLLRDALEWKQIEVAKLLITIGSKLNSKASQIKPSNTPLHFAVKYGDVEVVRLLLVHGANVNARNKFGETPLHEAAKKKDIEVSKLLVKHGAYVNTRSSEGKEPIDIAKKLRCYQIVQYLIKSETDVNSRFTESNCCERYPTLHAAVEKGSEDMVKMLLNRGGGVNEKVDGKSPLHIAAGKGCVQIAEDLLKHGADINSTYTSSSIDSFTPLHFAIMERRDQMASLLLKYGASADAQDKTGKTTLLLAVENGSLAIVENILKHCPYLNNQSNRNTLIAAVCGHGEDHTKITKRLYEYGFTVSPENVNNQEFLYNAIEKGYKSIVESLLQYGADVNMLYNYKSPAKLIHEHGDCSPLHFAVRHKQEEVVTLLVNFEADVNARDKNGKTPIYYAVKNDDLQITELLLFNKANIMVHPELLLIAVQVNNKEIIEVLLEHGADVNFSDEEGKSALYVNASCKKYHKSCDEVDKIKGEIAKLLLSRGAHVNATTDLGTHSLHAAAKNGYVRVVEALLEYNADVNSTVKYGLTSLHIAAKGNHLQVVETLLKFGAIIDFKDECGVTALHVASLEGHKSIVSALLDHGSDINTVNENNSTALDHANLGFSLFYQKGNAHCDYDYDNSLDPDIPPFVEVCDILHRHIVKIFCANFDVSRKNLHSMRKYALWYFQSECRDELDILHCVYVGDSKMSWYDIWTKSVQHLASLLENENIVQSLRTVDLKTKFPIYGSLICSHLRMAERRKKLLEEIDDYFFYIFPELPWECTREVLSYLTDNNIRNLIHACHPVLGSRKNNCDAVIASSMD